MKNSFRTDLACESRDVWLRTRGAALAGVSARQETRDGLGVETVEILDEGAAEELCKPMGRYVTISLDALVRREEDAFRRACGVLAREIRTQLAMEPEESVVSMVLPGDYGGWLLFFFENGKAARVELAKYQTVTRRKKLTGAYSDKSPLRTALLLREDVELAVYSTEGRALIFHTASLATKSTRTTQGVAVMTLKPKWRLDRAVPLEETPIVNKARYRARTLPASGALLRPEDRGEEQLTLG